jgi:D-alanine-D-alanine ligase
VISKQKAKLNVAVILGGDSAEREVSLQSGRVVANSLNPQLYRVRVYDPASGVEKIVKDAPQIDVALIMLHGRKGEDGAMQGLLTLLGIPYQCADVLGCALAMDKPLSKKLFQTAGLPLAPDVVLHKKDKKKIITILKELGVPVVVKPAREGSSIGVTIVHYKSHLGPALKKAFELDHEVLVERFIAGREFTCGVMGNDNLEALPLIEIIPSKDFTFFDYQAKYVPGASQEICPADLDPKNTKKIQDLAIKAHQTLKLQGYSRSDFILGPTGPVLLEVNTIPGMTKNSLLPRAARAAGMEFPTFLSRLINLALERYDQQY